MKYDLQALDATLAKRIGEKKLPGVSVAIRGPEGVIFEKGYGFCDEARTKPINEHTVMGVASMSKSTVTLALAMLAAEGKFDFNDPVTKYFPNFELKGSPKDAVTVHHLACHTAGIPPMEPLEWSIAMNTPGRDCEWIREAKATAPNKMETIDQIVDYIAEGRHKTLGGPGEYMSYSNEGYAILCYIFDQAAGVSLEEFLAEKVFGPIGMTRTVLDVDASEARKVAADGNITSLWERDKDGNFVVDDYWSVLPPFRSCGCIKSTAHDYARYYQCLSNGGVIDGVQVLPAAAVDMMCGLQFPLDEKPYYCYGLNKRLWQGHTICEHSGGLHGVSTHGCYLQGENYSYVAFCNEGDQKTDDLCWIMGNMLMGRPLEEEQVWLHPTGRQFSQPEMLEGRYICHEGIPVEVEVFTEDGKLKARRSEETFDLIHCGETWFLLFDKAGVNSGRCHFWCRDGKAWGVQVYTRIYQRIE